MLCITLSFTSLAFFKIGMAKFTVFHLFAVLTVFALFFIALKNRKFLISVPNNYLPLFAFICAVNIYHLNEIKQSSFVYSIIILLELLLLYNVSQKLTAVEVKRILKAIFLLYFLNIFISTILIMFEIFPTGFLGQIFQIYNFDHRIRPYGFSDEPSYAAIILVFALFLFFKCDNFLYKKEEFKWYVCASLSILLTRSSYGYLLLALLLFYFMFQSRVLFIHLNNIIRHKVFTRKDILPIAVFLVALFFITAKVLKLEESTSIKRLILIYESFATKGDDAAEKISNIKYVDGSASMRLVPTLYLIDDFNKSELKYVLFGRGAGQSVPFFSHLYDGNTTVLGFIPSFVYNYGLCGTALCFLFFYALFPRQKFVFMILFLLFILNADFNTQIFEFVLFTVMVSKKLEQEHSTKQLVLND